MKVEELELEKNDAHVKCFWWKEGVYKVRAKTCTMDINSFKLMIVDTMKLSKHASEWVPGGWFFKRGRMNNTIKITMAAWYLELVMLISSIVGLLILAI